MENGTIILISSRDRRRRPERHLRALLLATVLACTTPALAQVVRPYIGADLTGRYEPGIITIEKFPLSVRDVPIHPSDNPKDQYWFLPVEPIGNIPLQSLPKNWSTTLYAGIEISDIITIGGLLKHRWATLLEAIDAEENMKDQAYVARRNYGKRGGNSYTLQRKMYTAFTYYGQPRLATPKKEVLYGYFIRIDPFPDSKWNVYIEYDYIANATITAENGWDRHNRFEVLHTYEDIARVSMHELLLGLRLKERDEEPGGRISAYLGMGESTVHPREGRTAEGWEASGNTYFFAGLSFTLETPFKKR